MVDFGSGGRRGGARDGHAVDSNDRNTRAIQVTAYHRADHRSHPAAPARHRPDHRALSHPPPTLRGSFFGAGVVSPVVCEKVLERESVSERDADRKRARPSDHGDARASRPSRAYSVARAGERAARASRRPDRSPDTRAPRCRHAGCARRRQDSSSQRRSPRALRLRGRRARRRRGSRSTRAPRGVHRHGLRARAHTQDGPRRLRPRALRPGRLRPLPPPRPQSLLTLGVYAFLADPSRIRPRRRPSVRSDAAPHADRRGDGGPARRRVRAHTGRLWEQRAPRAARRAVPPAHPAANKKRNDHFCPLELAPYFPEKNTRVTNWYPFQL